MTLAAGIANAVFPYYLVNISGIGDFGRIISFVLVPLLWFYALSLGLLAGAVINALRFELHDTGTVRGMTADFEALEPERRERDRRGVSSRYLPAGNYCLG